MDITAQTFSSQLPDLLQDLTTCCFVSIDFEFSGVANTPGKRSRGCQSLQDRYAEIKSAADKYQILQVGLTICHENTETGLYELKPYNAFISPIIDPKLEVERDITLQSSAMRFLLGSKFCMEALYNNGVPYLSREEEILALSKVMERRDRAPVRDSLKARETDYESLAFLTTVRRLVDDWLVMGDGLDEWLNIPPPCHATAQMSHSLPSMLNNYHKRLVHQLVETEYPELTTRGQSHFIQIRPFDKAREMAVREQFVTRARERIGRQTGFRWIAEALVGGDLSSLDPSLLESIKPHQGDAELETLKRISDQIKQQLKAHRPVLVGHNMLTDLIYFCKCFLGPLPETVEEFQVMIHQLFPIVMDTKYLATHDCGSINPRSSLAELNDNFTQIPIPMIKVHPQHGKYKQEQYDHEAGYDSLLAARLFIKLSSQLRDGGVSKVSTPTQLTGDTQALRQAQNNASNVSTNGTTYEPGDDNPTDIPKERNEHHILESESGTAALIEAMMSLQVSSEAIDQKVDHGELIPRLGGEFWNVYGNKLRVFGTEEKVCIIGPGKVEA